MTSTESALAEARALAGLIDELASLVERYQHLERFAAGAPGRTPERRALMRVISGRFPGALRELERAGLAEVRRRGAGARALLEGLVAHARGAPALDRLASPEHAAVRGALAVQPRLREALRLKRWLAEAAPDAGTGDLAARMRAWYGQPAGPRDAGAWPVPDDDFLAAVATPPGGQVQQIAYRAAARALGVEVSDSSARCIPAATKTVTAAATTTSERTMQSPEPAPDSGFWTETRFRAAVVAGGLLLVLLMIEVRFGYDLTLPERPPRPRVTVAEAHAITAAVDRDPAAYAEYLRRDAATYGVAPVSPAAMGKVLPYFTDDTDYVLRPGSDDASVQIGALRLTAVVQEQNGPGKSLLLLQIENMGKRPLAYRVDTRPSKGTQVCHQKLDLPHNALAVAAGDMEVRSECIYRSGWALEIHHVETIALSDLSFHYVSRLAPAAVGLEARTGAGHRPPAGAICNVILSADVIRSIEQGETSWRDMIDFYARHRCETYTFPVGYRAFVEDDQEPLPVKGAKR